MMKAKTAHYGNVLQLETQKKTCISCNLGVISKICSRHYPPRVALFDIDLSALQWFCFRSPY